MFVAISDEIGFNLLNSESNRMGVRLFICVRRLDEDGLFSELTIQCVLSLSLTIV